MIYCVVPAEMEDELFDKLRSYYEDDPDVTVIVDRRKASRRKPGPAPEGVAQQREVRDRRRARVTGEFMDIDTPAE